MRILSARQTENFLLILMNDIKMKINIEGVNKMKRKHIAVVLAAALLFLAGCNSSHSDSEIQNSSSPNNTPSVTDVTYSENTQPPKPSPYPPFSGIDISENGLKFSTINNKRDYHQFFCSGNGIIYYSNPLDGLKLYSYDGEKATRLSDIQAFSLNYYDGAVYFLSSEKNYSFEDIIDGTLYKYDTESGRVSKISDISMNNSHVDEEGIFYVSLYEDGSYYVYKTDIENGTGEPQYRGFSVQHTDGYTLINQETEDGIDYFLQKGEEKIWLMSDVITLYDCMNNGVYYYRDYNDNYSLYSLDLRKGEKKLLCGERINDYTVFKDNLYLSIKGRLYRCLQDGTLDLFEFDSKRESADGKSDSDYQTVNVYAAEDAMYALVTYMEGKKVIYAFARLDISEQEKAVTVKVIE